jgi:hypothetical protein
MLEVDLSEWPALKAWADRINGREAVKKGLNVPKRHFTPEQFAERMKQLREKIDSLAPTA